MLGRGRARFDPESRLRRRRRRDSAQMRVAGRLLSVPDPAEEAVGRHLGDPLAAIGALLQVLVDRLGRRVVELAQAERAEGLVGRMEGRDGVHRAVSGNGVELTAYTEDERPVPRRTCRENHEFIPKGRRLPPLTA